MRKVRVGLLYLSTILLIGGFVHSINILQEAIGADIDTEISENLVNISSYIDQSWDDLNVYSGIYISGDRQDDDGNWIGTVIVSGGRYPITVGEGEDEVLIGHEYVAMAYSGGTGKANAWVKVPGKVPAHDEAGPGDADVDVDDPDVPDNMSAYDETELFIIGAGNRTMKSSAALSANGARVRVGYIIKGI